MALQKGWPANYSTESALEDSHKPTILGWLSDLMARLKSPVVFWYLKDDSTYESVGRIREHEREYKREACRLCVAIRTHAKTVEALCKKNDENACRCAYAVERGEETELLLGWKRQKHDQSQIHYYIYRCPTTNLIEWVVPVYVRGHIAGVFITGQFSDKDMGTVEAIIERVRPTLDALTDEMRDKTLRIIKKAHADLREYPREPSKAQVDKFFSHLAQIQAELDKFFDDRVRLFEIDSVNKATQILSNSSASVSSFIRKNGFEKQVDAEKYFEVIGKDLLQCIQCISESSLPITCRILFYPAFYRDPIEKTAIQTSIDLHDGVLSDEIGRQKESPYALNMEKLMEHFSEHTGEVLSNEPDAVLIIPSGAELPHGQVYSYTMDRKVIIAYCMSLKKSHERVVDYEESVKFLLKWLSSTFLALWQTGYSAYEEYIAKQASLFLKHEAAALATVIDGRITNATKRIDTAITFIDEQKRRGRNEVLKRYESDIGEIKELTRTLQRDSKQLNAAIGNYTILFADDLELPVMGNPIGLLEEVVDSFQVKLGPKGMGIRWDVEAYQKRVLSAVEVKCDPSLLTQAFVNLFENARKYSHDNTAIIVDAKVMGEGASEKLLITITNFGRPISEVDAQNDRIFELGYRGKNARLAHPGGLGYGLAIIRKIARAHAGDIRLVCNQILSKQYIIPQLRHVMTANISLSEKERARMDEYRYAYQEFVHDSTYHKVTYCDVDSSLIRDFDSLRRRVDKPTAEITFEISLPVYQKPQTEGKQP